MNQKKRQKSKKWMIPLLLILLLAGGAGGYFWWTQSTATAAKAAVTAPKTSPVKRGSLILSASGSGTVITNQKTNLGFSTSGTITAISVQVGDRVSQDQVLAEIGDTSTLQAALKTAELNLAAAKKSLNDLQSGGSAAISSAQLALATAQKAYDDAKSAVVSANSVRCDKDTLDATYIAYLREQDQLEKLGDGGGNQEYFLNQIVPQRNKVAQAKAKYDYCAGYTSYEIESSQATLAIKKAALDDAQALLKKLQANQGIDPDSQAELKNKVESAQVAYDKAKKTLDGATIRAPYAGTILSIAGQVGDTGNASTFISMADLDHPLVEFAVDESEMSMVKVGYPVELSFDALPNQKFTGKVTRIYPTLSTVSNYQVIKGQIQLDPLPGANRPDNNAVTLPVGLNASLTIISGRADNAILAPIEALRDLGNGQYGVFTVESSGALKLTAVKVGLKDSTYAEILEGLSPASVVSIGK